MRLKKLTPFPFGTKISSCETPRPESTLDPRGCHLLEAGEPRTVSGGTSLVAHGTVASDNYREDGVEPTSDLVACGARCARLLCRNGDTRKFRNLPGVIGTFCWVVALAATGCAELEVKRLFSIDASCPEDEIEVTRSGQLGPLLQDHDYNTRQHFRATGCGKSLGYTCERSGCRK